MLNTLSFRMTFAFCLISYSYSVLIDVRVCVFREMKVFLSKIIVKPKIKTNIFNTGLDRKLKNKNKTKTNRRKKHTYIQINVNCLLDFYYLFYTENTTRITRQQTKSAFYMKVFRRDKLQVSMETEEEIFFRKMID